MPYEAYLKAKAPPWLQDTYGQAWLGGIGATLDDYVYQYIAGVLAAFPEYAPADALGVLGDELGLDQGPNESNASFAARLRAAWIYWKLAGTPLGILTALYFAGFDGAVLVQQNGLQYSLSGAPQPGVDPTSLLTVRSSSQLATVLTSEVNPPTLTSAGRSIPIATPWFSFGGDTDFCSRFAIIFPGPFPLLMFYSNTGRATFSGSDTASVTWASAFPAGFTAYKTLQGPPVVTDGGGPVIVNVDGTSKTNAGCNVVASAAFNGYVDVSAAPSLSASDASKLAGVIRKWRPAKATCTGVYVITTGGRTWDYFAPGTTWDGGAFATWDTSMVLPIAGAF